MVIIPDEVFAGDGFLKKLKQHKKEFHEMAEYLVAKNYHKDFSEPVIFIDPGKIDDANVKAFCKRFGISGITMENYKDKGYTVPMDSVVVFHRDNTSVAGNRRDVIVDFASIDRSFNDFNEYGSQLIKIDMRMYYYKH
jgi:hypothetical protein